MRIGVMTALYHRIVDRSGSFAPSATGTERTSGGDF
jgi:hypothetical protein